MRLSKAHGSVWKQIMSDWTFLTKKDQSVFLYSLKPKDLFLQYCSHQYWMGSFNLLSILALSTLILNSAIAADKSRGNIKKENFSWERLDQKSNLGPLGDRRERYQLCYAPPPKPIYLAR